MENKFPFCSILTINLENTNKTLANTVNNIIGIRKENDSCPKSNTEKYVRNENIMITIIKKIGIMMYPIFFKRDLFSAPK